MGWARVRQTDKESGFLDLLEPKEEILAEWGFLIRDERAAYGATLRIPHFTKDKKQIPTQEVDSYRQLSRVRIQVERVIGRWKNFKILRTVIPLSQVNILDDVTVCGALTNLCKSVVPKVRIRVSCVVKAVSLLDSMVRANISLAKESTLSKVVFNIHA